MTDVDVHLITAWTERVLDRRRPVLKHVGVRLSDDEQLALGAGMAAIRSAILGEHAEPVAVAGSTVAADLERYLRGLAAGVEATGADRDPMSLVAGLVAGAAQLQYSRAGTAGDQPSAAESAARAGVAAADLAADGAELARVVGAAAEVAMSGWSPGPQADQQRADEQRLRVLIGMVLLALDEVARPAGGRGVVAGCGAAAGEHRGRRFLAEVTFDFYGADENQAQLAGSIVRMGTDLRVWPDGDGGVTHYHLHTTHPADVVAEVFAVGTPFALRIGTLEPPMSERGGTMAANFDQEGRADFDAS
ncbi:MAG: hypothetical protein M3Z00_02275 [Actinomycetota bacterium]|nr:hypothetical protein [Actinomycetota bacterium]